MRPSAKNLIKEKIEKYVAELDARQAETDRKLASGEIGPEEWLAETCCTDLERVVFEEAGVAP